jgi:hypothetical protein
LGKLSFAKQGKCNGFPIIGKTAIFNVFIFFFITQILFFLVQLWFSDFRETKICEILANCETLDLPSARTWVSGETNCSLPQCDISGICQV